MQERLALHTWTLDTTHSTVGFTVTYMGVAPFQGAFRELAATLDAEGLRGVAKASSIDVDNEQLAEHLASQDFFDAAAQILVARAGFIQKCGPLTGRALARALKHRHKPLILLRRHPWLTSLLQFTV